MFCVFCVSGFNSFISGHPNLLAVAKFPDLGKTREKASTLAKMAAKEYLGRFQVAL